MRTGNNRKKEVGFRNFLCGWSRSHIGFHRTDFAVRKSYMFPNVSPHFLTWFIVSAWLNKLVVFALNGLVSRKHIFKEPLNAEVRTTLQ